MEEKNMMNEEALLSADVAKKRIHKRYIRMGIIAAIALMAIVIVTVILCVSGAKAKANTINVTATEATVTDVPATQDPDILVDAPIDTTTTENDISTEQPTKPENNVESAKPTTPSVPNDNENKPTETPSEPSGGSERGEYPIDPPQNDRERLACVIYQEVGGNTHCDECRKRVGDVVLNRVNDPRFPNTIEGVLLQSGQYGKFSWTGIVWQTRAQYAGEKAAVERAYRIADELLAGNHSSLYGNGYVWQAGFTQGNGGFWCCGHYFGY